MGPFELADYMGSIQLWVEQEQDLLEDSRSLSYDTEVCPLVHSMYDRGHYGQKTGQGFYDYTDQTEPDIPESAGQDFDVMRVWGPVINAAAKMVQHDVAIPEDIDTGMKLGGNWPIGPLEKADEVGATAAVNACLEVAQLHPRMDNVAELLPCDLLVEKAKTGETFY
jgi:enoyl-CoA hydratase/3-hydroxyacyl-CoA dehydrogenase